MTLAHAEAATDAELQTALTVARVTLAHARQFSGLAEYWEARRCVEELERQVQRK